MHIFKKGSLNSSRSSPDSGFVFSFGGTQSSYPEVWVNLKDTLKLIFFLKNKLYFLNRIGHKRNRRRLNK